MKPNYTTPLILSCTAFLAWGQDSGKPSDKPADQPKAAEVAPDNKGKPEEPKPEEPKKEEPKKEEPKKEEPKKEEPKKEEPKKEEPKGPDDKSQGELPPDLGAALLGGLGKDKYGKSVSAEIKLFTPVVADARLSTVELITRNWSKKVCLATIVHESGYLLSKWSEVEKQKELDVLFAKSPQFPGGLRLPAKVVTRHKDYDLVLLKIDASGLKPVTWSPSKDVELGTFLAAPNLGEDPMAYGVASVEIRNLDMANRGFLGIRTGPSDKGVVIEQVTSKSPAEEAGVKAKEILVKINDTVITSPDEFQSEMMKYRPLEKVALELKTDDKVRKVEVTLRRRGEFPDAMRRFEDPRNMISGRLSEQRSGFPSALQHDLYLKPEQCGGPLVDLDGKVVGINIARSGRIESLAIPAPVLIDLLKNVAQGKFHIPEADDLQKEIAKMNDEKKKLEEDVARIKQLEEKLGRGLSDAQKRLDSLLGTGSDKPEEKKTEDKPAETKK